MTREEAIKVLRKSIDNSVEMTIREWEEFDKQVSKAIDMAIEALSADAVQGEWKHTTTGQPYCSNCEYVFGEDEEFSPFWDYCPMCGAKIKGGDDE